MKKLGFLIIILLSVIGCERNFGVGPSNTFEVFGHEGGRTENKQFIHPIKLVFDETEKEITIYRFDTRKEIDNPASLGEAGQMIDYYNSEKVLEVVDIEIFHYKVENNTVFFGKHSMKLTSSENNKTVLESSSLTWKYENNVYRCSHWILTSSPELTKTLN